MLYCSSCKYFKKSLLSSRNLHCLKIRRRFKKIHKMTNTPMANIEHRKFFSLINRQWRKVFLIQSNLVIHKYVDRIAIYHREIIGQKITISIYKALHFEKSREYLLLINLLSKILEKKCLCLLSLHLSSG